MKKILSSLAFVAAVAVFGQVAITGNANATPKATLDVEALSATGVTDGVLVPRMTYTVANTMKATAVESTLVWLTDGDGTCGKGFYYYDTTATDWEPVKNCSSGPVKQSIRSVTLPHTASDWTDNDYTIVISGAGTVEMPAPGGSNSGRILAVRNGNGTSITYAATNQPDNNNNIMGNRGQILQSDGTNWYVIGGF